ncbi:unnamed protein product [Camellia sinensis]
MEHLWTVVADNCLEIATNKSGCCVLQQCVLHAEGEPRERLLAEITRNALILAEHPYGSTAIPMLEAVIDVVPLEKLAVHFHDTYGQVVSNILVSLQFHWLISFHSLKDLSIVFNTGQFDLHKLNLTDSMIGNSETKLQLETLGLSGIQHCDYGLSWLWRSCKQLKKLQLRSCYAIGDESSLSSFVECLIGLQEVELWTCRAIINEHLCCLVTDIEVDEDVEQEDKPGVQNLSISVFYKRQSSQVKVLFISLLLRAFTSNSAESSDRDDNSGLSISDCMEKCWNNCSCVGFTTSNSNASPEKFSGFQIKHSRNAEKMVALKKAYADIILNTAKEAAARVMVSERKALRFHHDLCAAKDEALRMLLRFKQMFDSKTIEAEINSVSQQKRIEELKAQLDEAEETILDLRAELKKAQNHLDKVKNNHMRPLNKSTEKQDGPCHEGTPFNHRNMDCKCCNSAKLSESLKSDLENSCVDNPNFPSTIVKSKEPELYKNGCTQRVRAFERNLLDGNLPSSGNGNDQHFIKKGESITKVNEQNTEICTVPPPKIENIDGMKNPTRVEDKLCIKSCTYRDQPFKVRNIRRRKTRYGRAKATSCRLNPNLVKPHRPSSVLSRCKTSSCSNNDNVKSGDGACTLPYSEAENKTSMENSSRLEEKVQQNKDQALSVVRRSIRKRKVKCRDAIATYCRSLPDQLANLESETKIKTDVSMSGSTDVTPQINTVIASGFTGNTTFKDTGPVDEAVLVKQGVDAAESPGAPSYKSNQTDNKLLKDSNSKDAKTSEAMIETSSEADNSRIVKYTFSRKRKKELSTNPNENTSVGKSNAKKRAVVEKQNGAPEPQKAGLIDESSRDSRRMVQVARQQKVVLDKKLDNIGEEVIKTMHFQNGLYEISRADECGKPKGRYEE